MVGLLRSNDHADVQLLPDVHLAAWAKEWPVASPPGQIVETAFIRSDSRLRLYVSVVDGVVAGLWRGGAAGSWAVELAREWVDAVRHRDLDRLARVTTFPFELRDRGRDATCGKQVVKTREGLARGVDCLFRSAQLQRAMTDSPVSGYIISEPGDSLPNWLTPWWRESEHRGLQRVMTMVSTVEGYEYDFQILMARDGVRVVWKSGAFEARD